MEWQQAYKGQVGNTAIDISKGLIVTDGGGGVNMGQGRVADGGHCLNWPYSPTGNTLGPSQSSANGWSDVTTGAAGQYNNFQAYVVYGCKYEAEVFGGWENTVELANVAPAHGHRSLWVGFMPTATPTAMLPLSVFGETPNEFQEFQTTQNANITRARVATDAIDTNAAHTALTGDAPGRSVKLSKYFDIGKMIGSSKKDLIKHATASTATTAMEASTKVFPFKPASTLYVTWFSYIEGTGDGAIQEQFRVFDMRAFSVNIKMTYYMRLYENPLLPSVGLLNEMDIKYAKVLAKADKAAQEWREEQEEEEDMGSLII